MTVTTSARRVQYVQDGTSSLFTMPFPFPAATDLRVTRTTLAGAETALLLNVDFTAHGAGAPGGGYIKCLTPGAPGERLTIRRVIARTQTTDYVPNDPFPADTHEAALDKLTMISQEDGDELTRALTVPDTDPARGHMQLPPMPGRAGKALVFDAAGQPAAALLGGPADGSLRADLAATTGTDLIGYGGQTLTSFINRLQPVERFGAVGDGIADDTPALLAALAADNRVLLAPGRTYRITASLPLATDRKIIGEGAVLLVDADVPAITNLTGASVLFAEVENLVIRAARPIAASALALVDTSWSKFRNVRIDRAVGGAGFSHGVRLSGSVSACYWNKFFDIVVTAVTTAGFRIAGGSNDNRFYDAHLVNHISGYPLAKGLWLETGANNAFFGLTLEAVWDAPVEAHAVWFADDADGTVIHSLRTEGATGTAVAKSFGVRWGGHGNTIIGHRILGVNTHTGDPRTEGRAWSGITTIIGPAAAFAGGTQLNLPHGTPVADQGAITYEPAAGEFLGWRDSARKFAMSPAISDLLLAGRKLRGAAALGVASGSAPPAAAGELQLFWDGSALKGVKPDGTILTFTAT